MEFNSLEELKKRITPALKLKVEEFKQNSIDYITEDDIWNYLKDYKWKKSVNLSLADMVDDILKLDLKSIVGE